MIPTPVFYDFIPDFGTAYFRYQRYEMGGRRKRG
jgi:hypothetical protein